MVASFVANTKFERSATVLGYSARMALQVASREQRRMKKPYKPRELVRWMNVFETCSIGCKEVFRISS